MQKINIEDKFQLFDEHWSPKIIADLNGQAVKLAKIEGEFVWHQHEEEDELFYVVKGVLKMEFRDKEIILHPGEMIVVPKGIEHRPVAEEEVWIMLFEPLATKNTGGVESELTVDHCERI